MKTPALVSRIATSAFLAVALLVPAAGAAVRTPRVSPDATCMQTIGVTDVTLTYSRPGVKGRVIWGGVVPHDTTWRTGANDATTITFTDPVTVNGQPLAAGKYSFFTLPGKETWSIIFSRQKDLWGAYAYNPSDDALRAQAKPEAAEFTEWMDFEFDSLTAKSARLSVRWEKLRVSCVIGVDTDKLLPEKFRAAVAEAKSDDWSTPYQAARYCFDNNAGTADEMNAWLEKSLAVKATLGNQGLKARVLAKAGKKAEAVALAEKAVQEEKARTLKAGETRANTSALEKAVGEWKGK